VQCCPSLIYGANNKGLRPIDLAQRDEIRQAIHFAHLCCQLTAPKSEKFAWPAFFEQFLKAAEKASMVPAVQMQNLAKESKMLTGMASWGS